MREQGRAATLGMVIVLGVLAGAGLGGCQRELLESAPAVDPGPSSPIRTGAPLSADTAAAAAAVAWLQSQRDATTEPDARIAAILATAAVGEREQAAQWWQALVADQAGIAQLAGDGTTTARAYGLARLVVAAIAVGADPHAVAGRDLAAELAALADPVEGRFVDRAAADTSDALSQAWAVFALTAAGTPVAQESLNHLATQQCADGGYRVQLSVSTCVADPEATAIVVIALQSVGISAGDAVIANGVAWLQEAAQPSIADAAGQPDTGVTAIASVAIAGAGGDIADQRSWLLAQQVPTGTEDAGAFTVGGSGDVVVTAEAVAGLVSRLL